MQTSRSSADLVRVAYRCTANPKIKPGACVPTPQCLLSIHAVPSLLLNLRSFQSRDPAMHRSVANPSVKLPQLYECGPRDSSWGDGNNKLFSGITPTTGARSKLPKSTVDRVMSAESRSVSRHAARVEKSAGTIFSHGLCSLLGHYQDTCRISCTENKKMSSAAWFLSLIKYQLSQPVWALVIPHCKHPLLTISKGSPVQ